MILTMVGLILLGAGIVVGFIFFGINYRPRKARVGLLLSAAGLLVLTITLFDYSGDFTSKITKVVQVGMWPSLEFFGTGYLLAWIAIIAGLAATRQVAQGVQVQRAAIMRPPQQQILENAVPTGYRALDSMLYGGLPVGSSIVLTGPPCDEKNLILKRFMETNLISNCACIFISTSLDRVRDLLPKYGNKLHVIICNPQADSIAAAFPQVVKLKALDSLTQINLEYDNAVTKLGAGRPTVLCLEILDDMLLEHHEATRRWLMGILGRSKTNQMTSMAALNPAMHTAEENQAVLETFDGHFDLYEAEIQVRPKVIRVRKFGGRRFVDDELRVQKESI